MKSFLSIEKKVDELSYFKTLLNDFRAKSNESPYAERRAFELNDLKDVHLEKELEKAMEEVSTKEKDFL